MKTIQCLDCSQQFVGGNKEEIMNMMMPHYSECHKEVMEEGTEEKRAEWMSKFNSAWEQASDM